jgi:hypothetical protein
MFVEGANNTFNEPPDKIWQLDLIISIYIIQYQKIFVFVYIILKTLDENLMLKIKNINRYKYIYKLYKLNSKLIILLLYL